ncbi:hypothetical protein [Rhodomicrobium lacus]|nr:hypothetical protein [Rhodomicrobium lacus]
MTGGTAVWWWGGGGQLRSVAAGAQARAGIEKLHDTAIAQPRLP